MHVLISRSSRDVCSPRCSVSLTHFHPAQAAVLMPALYHSAPEGQAGSSTSHDLNATNSSYSFHPFRILSAAFKWTLNQVGPFGTCEYLSWIITSDCLSGQDRKEDKKEGRKGQWVTGRECGAAANNFPLRASSRLWSHNYHLFSLHFHDELPKKK